MPPDALFMLLRHYAIIDTLLPCHYYAERRRHARHDCLALARYAAAVTRC